MKFGPSRLEMMRSLPPHISVRYSLAPRFGCQLLLTGVAVEKLAFHLKQPKFGG
jgi:hypothetical protein